MWRRNFFRSTRWNLNLFLLCSRSLPDRSSNETPALVEASASASTLASAAAFASALAREFELEFGFELAS